MSFNVRNIFTSLTSQTPLLNGLSPSSDDFSALAAYQPFSGAPSCPLDGAASCHNTTNQDENSCCFIYPGGQLLQTQFWDTHPAVGPSDSWTLHGLWPDLCDGTYDQFCDQAPQYHNITQILEAAGQDELLNFMNEYWLPDRGTSEHFWEHEWNKHGTCINTLSPDCYGEDYVTGVEVVDFFTRTVALFKTLDTFKALAAAGIHPSYDQTYDHDDIESALSAVTGGEVVLGCQHGALNQAWYSFNVKGSAQTGTFVPTDPAGKGGRGTCPKRGIKYLPKDGGDGDDGGDDGGHRRPKHPHHRRPKHPKHGDDDDDEDL